MGTIFNINKITQQMFLGFLKSLLMILGKMRWLSCGLRQVALVLQFTWIYTILCNKPCKHGSGFIVTQISKIRILICAVHMKVF